MKKVILITYFIMISLSIVQAGSGIKIMSDPGHYAEPKAKPKESAPLNQCNAGSKEERIKCLEDQVRSIPASDRTANLAIYEQLLELDPDNYEYHEKAIHYSKPYRKKRSGVTIEQLLE